jgi:hypothetical protein
MPYCRRCGAEIATANLFDIDPGVDRAHFALVTPGGREQLPPFEWRLFEALYQRHGRIVCIAELATTVGLAEDAVRGGVCRLRRLLTCSRFRIIMHRGYGYELIAMREESSAVTTPSVDGQLRPARAARARTRTVASPAHVAGRAAAQSGTGSQRRSRSLPISDNPNHR